LKRSFEILNEWALYLEDWDIRVRAMCGILEASLNLTPAQFKSVMWAVHEGRHSKKDIREALENPGDKGFGGASDVVGHPPGPPYTESSF
jgi:hypothetical protein